MCTHTPRPSRPDALAILELSLLFNMYPFHNRTRLGAWQHALASDENAFALRRMTLAHTLTLLAQARAVQAGPARDVERLEGAMIAGAAAKALLQESGGEGELEGATSVEDGSRTAGLDSRAEGVDDAMVGVAEAAAAALQDAKVKELRRLLGERWGGRRPGLAGTAPAAVVCCAARLA